MTSRVEEDLQKLNIDAQSMNHLVDQASGKLVKLTISNQPQPEVKHFKQYSIRKHPYQRPATGNTTFTIYAEKGPNIYTSSKENPTVITVRSVKGNERREARR